MTPLKTAFSINEVCSLIHLGYRTFVSYLCSMEPVNSVHFENKINIYSLYFLNPLTI